MTSFGPGDPQTWPAPTGHTNDPRTGYSGLECHLCGDELQDDPVWGGLFPCGCDLCGDELEEDPVWGGLFPCGCDLCGDELREDVTWGGLFPCGCDL